jgi:hypothetical protein
MFETQEMDITSERGQHIVGMPRIDDRLDPSACSADAVLPDDSGSRPLRSGTTVYKRTRALLGPAYDES